MTWRITRDVLCENDPYYEPSAVGRQESHLRIPVQAVAAGFQSPELPTGDKKVEFRLYDDDGELYYEGILDDDNECSNQLAALTWGEGDSGCTIIKVKRGNEWKQEIG